MNGSQAITEEAARAIGVDAYLYFYPLISVDITRKQSTNIEAGKEFGKGPMNTFVNIPAFPPADLKVVVRINFDTLYSIAWLTERSPRLFPCQTRTGGFTLCRCSTCGRMCSPRRAGGRPEPKRPISL